MKEENSCKCSYMGRYYMYLDVDFNAFIYINQGRVLLRVWPLHLRRLSVGRRSETFSRWSPKPRFKFGYVGI
jgi:hypothetical protein